MRLRLAVLAAITLVAAVGATYAQTGGVSAKADRVYRSGSYVDIIARISNQSDKLINEATVECSAFDMQKQGVGVGKNFPKHILPGQTIVAEILASAPPESPTSGLTAECRVYDIE